MVFTRQEMTQTPGQFCGLQTLWTQGSMCTLRSKSTKRWINFTYPLSLPSKIDLLSTSIKCWKSLVIKSSTFVLLASVCLKIWQNSRQNSTPDSNSFKKMKFRQKTTFGLWNRHIHHKVEASTCLQICRIYHNLLLRTLNSNMLSQSTYKSHFY